jgi:hypothetical protein
MKDDPMLVDRVKADPVSALQHAAAGSVLTSDRFIYRIVVSALSIISLIGVLGAMVLSFYKIDTPPAVIALGSTALGALAVLIQPQKS